ncbi:MAG: hypothetical protein ISS46_03300 [Candidatus Omnitrophica bacterium]|nr:hypothetical protein [Candidatus Omnitrophota bacterium]
MVENKIPPEEKLLKLIRGDKIKTEEKKPPGKKFFSRPDSNFRKALGLLWDKSLGKAIPLGVPVVARVKAKPLLVFIIIILFCCIGYKFRSGIRIKNRTGLLDQGKRREKNKIQEEDIALKPYSYYGKEIAGKSLFTPLVIEKPASIVKTEKIEELCKGYQVKGIIMGERPEAFIEDSQSRRTFTVTIGDTIGKLQVKDIKEGRVIFGYENETYDLFF